MARMIKLTYSNGNAIVFDAERAYLRTYDAGALGTGLEIRTPTETVPPITGTAQQIGAMLDQICGTPAATVAVPS